MSDSASYKTISCPDHLELYFEGNVLKNALCFGDVDNDGFNELVVGNENGDLAIFKGDATKPVYNAKGLGMISAVAVGDVLNIARNVLVVITACGHCYIFEVDTETVGEMSKRPLVPLHCQRIPSNVKVILIGDINGDGFSEMIVGLTDRVVRAYRWVHTSETLQKKPVGKFIGLNKWEFAEQIGTITINKSSDGKPCILVSQLGGTFITLKVDPQYHNQSEEPLDESPGAFLTKISFTLEPLASSKLRNSEICGNIKLSKQNPGSGSPFAVASLDGILLLVQDGNILWNQIINHELFAVTAVDINGDGNDEIIACAWDGSTFIISHKQECVQFVFQEAVNTFTAGTFGIGGKQVPALVYVTFNNKICIYYGISVPYFRSASLLEILKDDEEYKTLVKSLGVEVSDTNALKQLNKYVAYGYHKR